MTDLVPKDWHGLMEILDDIYPESVIPTVPDREDRDLGPRIVSLVRYLAEAREREQRVRALAARWRSIPGMAEIGRGFDAALDGPQDGAT